MKKLELMLRDMRKIDAAEIAEIRQINKQRLFIFVLLAIPIHLIFIVIFWLKKGGKTGIELTWSSGILTAHMAALVFITIVGILAWILLRKNPQSDLQTDLQGVYHADLRVESPAGPLVTLFQGVICVGYLVLGAVICAIDLLVTTNITAFLLGCVMVSLFLNRPARATVYYAVAFVVYFIATSFVPLNADVMLSVKMNGLVVSVMGICITLFLWRNEIVNIRQKILIRKQKQELVEKNRQLEQMATHDGLTGLLNRGQFDSLVKMETDRMNRSEKEACIVILDIDFFKNINDKYGHPQGDIVLKEVASIINNHLRTTDIAARLGGEEFIILLPETGLGGGYMVAEKLRQAIQQHVFCLDPDEVRITASFGVTKLSSNEVEPFIIGYKNADNALYRAKRNGRNCVC